MAGGSDATLASKTQIYDLGTYAALASPPTLPRAPQSIAVQGTVATLVDSTGATVYDFSDSASADLQAPSGLAFSDVAGGATIEAPDGTRYVVGATRKNGSPSTAILIIDGSGNVSAASLSTARLGAAATWVEGRGLVVVGGSSAGAGIELLASGGSLATSLPYPAEATSGGAAAPLDANHVVLVAGATSRLFDLACGSTCAATAWGHATPVAFTDVQAFPSGSAAIVAIGTDASGESHFVRVTPADATESRLRTARKNACPLALPGSTVVVGGGAATLESFVVR